MRAKRLKETPPVVRRNGTGFEIESGSAPLSVFKASCKYIRMFNKLDDYKINKQQSSFKTSKSNYDTNVHRSMYRKYANDNTENSIFMHDYDASLYQIARVQALINEDDDEKWDRIERGAKSLSSFQGKTEHLIRRMTHHAKK